MTKKIVKRTIIVFLSVFLVLFLTTLSFLLIKYNSISLNIDQLTTSNTGVNVYASSYLKEDALTYKTDRKIINISELQPHTIYAFVDIEDKRFFRHNGYDPKRILKSSLVNLKSNTKSQGASTITQQLVKNTLLSNEKTYERKLNEIMLAIKVEKNFSKSEILNMYLNTIYFGSNAYGIENASQIYFNKSASELDINESAILAGLIKSPKTYSPKYNPENCFKRKNLVLKQMYENHHITEEEYEKTINMQVPAVVFTKNYENSYHQQAIIEACNILEISEKELIRNNYQILTFMDTAIQDKLEEILSQNEYKSDKLAIVASADGKIVAYLGSSNYDLSNMSRTPASTLKPLSVYLPSIIHNICHTQTPIFDEKIDFDGYCPRNSQDEYAGWITVSEALSESKNIPAVKLLNCLGLEKSIEFLNRINIETSEEDKNLSLALGAITNGVKPLRLLEGYSIFQNYGNLTKLRFVDKILDKDGKIIYNSQLSNKNVCDAESAYLITESLKDVAKTGTAKILNSLNLDIASKTGTNFYNGNSYDLWNISFSKNFSVLTWLGDAKGEKIDGLTSSFHATNISKQVFKFLKDKYDIGNFDIPESLIEKNIDLIELDVNHKLCLAEDDTPDRYTKKALFKPSSLPPTSTIFTAEPNLDLELELTTRGAKFTLNLNEIFDYNLIKISEGNEEIIKSFSNCSTDTVYLDDKIFSKEKVTYKLHAKNKYSNEEFYGEEKTIYPLNFLLSNLNNSKVNYNTKKRWYV